MDKSDTRKLSRHALKAMRGQSTCLRQELGVNIRDIARDMVLNTTTVIGMVQRYAAQGEAGLVSRKRRCAYAPDCKPPGCIHMRTRLRCSTCHPTRHSTNLMTTDTATSKRSRSGQIEAGTQKNSGQSRCLHALLGQ